MNSFNWRCKLCIDEKISKINFKNCKLMLNERNELVFKCRHKGRFKLSRLGDIEVPTMDKNGDIHLGCHFLKTFNPKK